MQFEVLAGLPPYGPAALPFSVTGMGSHSEGYVIRFLPTAGDAWVGNFQPGETSLFKIIPHPNERWVVVIAGGEAYVVDPDTQTLIECLPGWHNAIYEVPSLHSWLLAGDCDVMLLGPSGVAWSSRRLAWDGLRIQKVDGLIASGEADHYDGSVHSFSVNLANGVAVGGSYDWPEP